MSCGKNARKTDQEVQQDKIDSQNNENSIRKEYQYIIDVLDTLEEIEKYYKFRQKFTKSNHINYAYNKLKSEYFPI